MGTFQAVQCRRMIAHYLLITICQSLPKATPGLQAQEWQWQARQAFKVLDKTVGHLHCHRTSPNHHPLAPSPGSYVLCSLRTSQYQKTVGSYSELFSCQFPEPSPHQVAWSSTKLRPKLPVPQGNIVAQGSCLSDAPGIPQPGPVSWAKWTQKEGEHSQKVPVLGSQPNCS